MTTTARPPASTTPRQPALAHRDAMTLAALEYQRSVQTLDSLAPVDWGKPTDCPDWDVRQLAAHMVGMAAMATNPLESARQQKRARAEHANRGGPMIDSLTAVQVGERAGRSPAEIVTEARRIAPKAARGRRLTPRLVRRRTFPEPQLLNGSDELWTLGYLLDVILTRDPWMHRIDLARATQHDLQLSPDHDGVIVDDVVREWAGRHGHPYRLELTGAAGGQWASAELPPTTATISMDAIEFCRTLSGRVTGIGLLATQVPF